MAIALCGWALLASRDPCAHAGDAIAEVWTPAVRAELSGPPSAHALPWVAQTATAVASRLDGRAQGWSRAARTACLDAPRNDDTAACLQRSKDRIRDMVDRMRSGEPSLWVDAVADTELLPDPVRCLESPDAIVSLDQAILGDVRDLQRRLGAWSVPRSSPVDRSPLDGTDAVIARAVAAAEARDHPALAWLHWLAGRWTIREREPAEAEVHLRRALTLAHQRGDERLAIAASVELVYAVSRTRERAAEAEDLASSTAAMIAREGDLPLLRARLLSHRASALAHAPNPEAATSVELHRQAVALLRDTLGADHPDTLAARGNLGAALNYAERPEEASDVLTGALADAERVWGDEHPRTATLLSALGLARVRQGDFAQAEANLRRALEIRAANFGADHAQMANARYNLAIALRRQARHEEAVQQLLLGLAARQAVLGAKDPALSPWWVALGESQLATGDLVRARDSLEAALRGFETVGAVVEDYVRVRTALAQAWEPQDPERARVYRELAADPTRRP